MANKILTIAINGDISVEVFARGIRRFADLLAALHSDVGAAPPVEWMLTDLQYSSAIATAEARPKPGEDWSTEVQEHVDAIIKSYYQVGVALETGEPIPYTHRVEQRALRVKELIDGGVESIRFETPDEDVTIQREPLPHPLPETARPYAWGAVQGRVQALTNRGTLRFTLYDVILDRAVSCYMEEGREDQMKDIWGKLALVEGWVKRDPKTGRPLTVRAIRSIHTLPEPERGAYRQARGAVKLEPGEEDAKVVIRRLRDAG